MIILDSTYINNGGGFILLKYLVEIIKKSQLNVFFLFDNRTKSYFEKDEMLIHKSFISNSIYERKSFYKKNKGKFKTVFCFGNVPPPIPLDAKVIVYFHQPLFLDIPREFSFKNKVIYNIKQFILNYYKRNANIWLTQSEFIQTALAEKYFSGNKESIKILPFYPPLDFNCIDVERHKGSFLYVSNSSPHKNHERLIFAFCEAFDQTHIGSLTITVPQSDVNLCCLIDTKIKQGYPINNVGFVNRECLIELYLSHEFLIFPSLAESFGLGLAEGIDRKSVV